jgi:DNA-binding XRE family transcriptional regulator
MANRKRKLDPGKSPAAFFGSEIRRAREAAGMAQAELAHMAGYDPSVVSKCEGGEWPATDALANACDKAFPERGGWFLRFYADSHAWAGFPAWFADWVQEEQRASAILWHEPLLIPGLLQTEGYARALLTWKPDSADAEANLSARLGRQAILNREEPPELHVLMMESVLGHEVGDADVMAAQVDHLQTVAARPNVTIRIVPDTTYGAFNGAFAVARCGTAFSATYIESGVRGMTLREPEAVDRAVRLFSALCAEALPWNASLDILRKASERWNMGA